MPKFNDEGENRVANILFGSTAVDAILYMGLYTAPSSEPAETAVVSDLTEPSGGAYARLALTRGSWTITASAATYLQQTFTATGGAWGSVYGYFITTTLSGTGGLLMAVENFSDGPYSIGDGDTVRIAPSITIA